MTTDALALIQQNPAPQSSVTLSQTAKGLTQVEVKAYGTDLDEVAARAQAQYDRLCAVYAAAP